MHALAPFKERLSSSLIGTTLLLSLGLTVVGTPGRAESPETAPEELKETLSQIESAANRQDLEAVMEFYSSDFTNSDGLQSSSLSQALSRTWQEYSGLTYTTELLSWENTEEGLVAETQTNIRGTKDDAGRLVTLNSTIRSRQYFRDRQLIRQEILSEETRLTSGNTPPSVMVIVPEQVEPGEEFNFDVIVEEPLGNDVLLGTAIEEPTGGNLYSNPSTLELELLSAGGIFKLVKAPTLPEDRWLSATLVQADGITTVVRRVRVEE